MIAVVYARVTNNLRLPTIYCRFSQCSHWQLINVLSHIRSTVDWCRGAWRMDAKHMVSYKHIRNGEEESATVMSN